MNGLQLLIVNELAYDFCYFADGIGDCAERNLQDIQKWRDGYIPKQCKFIVTGGGYANGNFNPNDIESFNAHYDDSSQRLQPMYTF